MNDFEILEQLSERQILDTDLYKMSMMWFVMNHYPNSIVRYDFIDRKNHKYPQGLGNILRKRLDSFRNIKMSTEQRNTFQKKCGSYLPNMFFDFLEGFRLDPSEVSIYQEADGQLKTYAEGYWYRLMLWEIIILSEISEINYLMTGEKPSERREELKEKNLQKANKLKMNAVKFMDFGTRRRYSFENQKNVIRDLKSGGGNMFVGTSNILFGIENDVKILGTCAHEVICATGALKGYNKANLYFMEDWAKTYNGSLGTMLTDSFGVDNFLDNFDGKMARLFDSVRQDSGDCFKFADKMIEHYKKLNIDPMTKTIIFSDGLNVDSAIKVADYCRGKINTSFGIGTFFTNDLKGITPLNIVMKLTKIDGIDVIKLSDVEGKHTGNKETVELVKKLINYKPLI